MTSPKSSRIRRIELTPLHVPFRPEVKEAMAGSAGGLGMAIPAEEAWLGGDFVICKLVSDDGHEGIGEAFVWLPETGVSPEQLVEVVATGLSNYILGASPFDVQKMRRRMDDNVARCDVAKGLVDIACYDLMGQITGRPAHDFMGGKCVDAVPAAALIPLVSVETMVLFANHFKALGHKTIRFKLGRGIDADREIAAAIREAMGPDIRLRVDYNQAYTPERAIRAIQAIEPYGIDCAEQPVRATDTLGMVQVQKAVRTPLMAHEGCFSLQEIVDQVEMGAVRIVGVNAERPGGVTQALKAIDYAARRGLGVILHNQPLGISSAMQVHLATARHHDLGHEIELFGHIMMEDDLIKEPLDYSNGQIKVPTAPGWGVALDTDALGKYATGKTRVVESKK